MKGRTWDNMTEDEKREEEEECRRADALEAQERKDGYTFDSDYDPC